MFVHIPKCAGRSIAKGLLNRDRPLHITAFELQRLAPEKFAKYYKFAFIRNPWDRMVSFYSMLKTSPAGSHRSLMRECIKLFGSNDFSSFLSLVQMINDGDKYDLKSFGFESSYELHPQYFWVYDKSGNLICDFIGRYETLLGDYNNLCKSLGLADRVNQLPRLGVSKNRRTYQSHYDSYTRDIISCVFKKDIDTFSYEF